VAQAVAAHAFLGSAVTTIAAGATVRIPFDNETVNTNGWHDLSSTLLSQKLEVEKMGVYQFETTVVVQPNGVSGTLLVEITDGNSNPIASGKVTASSLTAEEVISAGPVLVEKISPPAYKSDFYVQVTNFTSASVQVRPTTGSLTFFEGQYLGA
jgi:Predicted ATPase, RNase L inhibitor (RLI) homolog